MEYPKKEGKHGPIYQIADCLFVVYTPHGTWQLVLRHGAHRKKKTFGKGEEERQRAIKAAELLAARLDLTPETQTDTSRTFGMVAEEWYRMNAARWQPGTKERYQSIVRDFLRPLHNLPLVQVDRSRIKRLLAELMQIRSSSTVEVVHAVISGIFSEAIDLGYTEQNPAYGLLKRILPPKSKRTINEPDPFTQRDLEMFLQAAWAQLPEPFPLILETMAMTGMRLGEALAMREENLDSGNHQYQVTESTKLGKFGPPKSGKRLIDLDATMVAKLDSHIKRMRKTSLAEGNLPGFYLFPGITQRMVQRAMERACKAARIRVRHPHDLRHSYATILLMAHMSPAYVQKQLGHHSISMTVDIYGHWIPGEGKKDLVNILRGPKARPGQALSLVNKEG